MYFKNQNLIENNPIIEKFSLLNESKIPIMLFSILLIIFLLFLYKKY